MGAFESPYAYGNFADYVGRQARHRLNTESTRFLKAVVKASAKHAKTRRHQGPRSRVVHDKADDAITR